MTRTRPVSKLAFGICALLLAVSGILVFGPLPSASAQTTASGTVLGNGTGLIYMNVANSTFVVGNITYSAIMFGDVTGAYSGTAEVMPGPFLTPNLIAQYYIEMGGVPTPVTIFFPADSSGFIITSEDPPGVYNWTQHLGNPDHPVTMWTASNRLFDTVVSIDQVGTSQPIGGSYPNILFAVNFTFTGNYTGELLPCGAKEIQSQVADSGTFTSDDGSIVVNYTRNGTTAMIFAPLQPCPITSTKPYLDKFVYVNSNLALADEDNVNVKIYYTQAEVEAAKIKGDTLKIYRWDDLTWSEVPGSGIGSDGSGTYVGALLEKFGVYCAVGDTPPAEIPGKVTLKPSISVTISEASPSEVDYGVMAPGTEALSPVLQVVNDGSVAEDLLIKGANATCGAGTWTLADTPGADQYSHLYGIGMIPASYTPLSTTDASYLGTDVVVGGTVNFRLKIQTPTSSTVYGQYATTVTILAVAH